MQKIEKIEELQLDNQRLTKRISALQDLENKRKEETTTTQAAGGYWGGGLFSGNNSQ